MEATIVEYEQDPDGVWQAPDPAGPPARDDSPEGAEGLLEPRFSNFGGWRAVNGNGAGHIPEATLMEVAPGFSLFYPAELNAVFGPSESLKSWMALAACRQELLLGETVVYIDFESNRSGILGRLAALGIEELHLDRFWYLQPSSPLREEDRADAIGRLLGVEPTLIVVDGLSEVLGLFDLEVNSATDVAHFENAILRPLSAGGAGVVLLHHSPWEADRPLGSQHIRSMITGSAFVLEPRGVGRSMITVSKDRHHRIRARLGGRRSLGYFTVNTVPDGVSAYVELFPELVS